MAYPLAIEVDGVVHRGDVRTEATFRPLVEYRRVHLALALLWPPDSLLRRIERDAPRANVLAVSWVAEQADRWLARLGYESLSNTSGPHTDREQPRR